MTSIKTMQFSHARTAFKVSINILGIKENNKILIPDFICESILHPLDAKNIQPSYYSLKDDLSPDWEKLTNLVDINTSAILMVHYFGQPQNIQKFQDFCRLHNLYLIEDNSHGHGGKYNGKLLGTYGDVGFSSPRKLINIYSGGILFINKKDLEPFKTPFTAKYPVKTYLKILRIISKYFPKMKIMLKKTFKNRPLFENPRAFPESIINDYYIDSSSKKILDNTDWDKVQTERKNEYNKWESFIRQHGLKPVYNKLDPGASPWFYPAYIDDDTKATEWFNWGWQNGYNVISWPALPEEIIIKNTSALKRWKKLICFPIHNSNLV